MRQTTTPDVARKWAPPWRPSRLRWELYAFLELCALCGFALAQPLLDVTGRSPDMFVSYQADARDIGLLVVAITLLPPLALWAVGAATTVAGERARSAAQVALVGMTSAVLALTLGKRVTPLRGLPLVAVAVLAAVGLTVLYARSAALKHLLRIASVAPLVFAVLFLLTSPTSALVLPHRTQPIVAAPTGAPAPGQHPPIVWLELDEFPLISLLDGHGRIDAERYPNFAWLAGHSTWYRNATGVSAWTPFALPAMLDGRYPSKGVAAHYSEYPDNLFTLFSKTYALNVHETISLLCPPRNCGVPDEPPPAPQGPGGGLRAALKQSAKLAAEMVSPAAPSQAKAPTKPPRKSRVSALFRFNQLRLDQTVRLRQFLQQLQPSATPRLDFLHLLLPHGPFHYLPSGTEYAYPGSTHPVTTMAKRSTQQWWSQLAHDRHLLQVAYTDRELGDALRTLRERGLFDKALVVVTADHGISFRPAKEPRRLHPDKGNAADLLWVPLFIKAPQQRAGKVDDRNWEQVDLLPTIADYAGIPVPWQMEGVSALRPGQRQRPERYYYDVPRQRLLVDGPSTFAKVLRASPRVVSPAPGLLGRPTGSPPSAGAGAVAYVENLKAFASVQPSKHLLPAFVYGKVSARVPRGALLAIAVNGRIGAVAPALPDPDDGVLRFAGIVTDEKLFVPGANRLEVLLVQGDGTSLRRLAVRYG